LVPDKRFSREVGTKAPCFSGETAYDSVPGEQKKPRSPARLTGQRTWRHRVRAARAVRRRRRMMIDGLLMG